MNKKLKKKLMDKAKVGVGVPLAYGSLAFAGGKLPGVMGSTVTSAIAPASGMVGAVSKVSLLGMGFDVMKESFKVPKKKKR